jgi:hypothetical protein
LGLKTQELIGVLDELALIDAPIRRLAHLMDAWTGAKRFALI